MRNKQGNKGFAAKFYDKMGGKQTAVAMGKTMFAVGLALLTESALAQVSGGDPLGSGMCYFVTLLTGKWAFGLSIVGLAATAGSFIGGVEMNEFMKKMASIFMVICILLAGTAIIRAFANFISPGIATCN